MPTPPPKVIWREKRATFVVRYLDPNTGKWREESAKSKVRKKADTLAGKIAERIATGTQDRPSRTTWADFRERYRTEKLPSMAAKTAKSFDTAANHLERLLRPKMLADVNTQLLSRFQSRLRADAEANGKTIADASIASYLRSIRAALTWAKKIGLIRAKVEVEMPTRGVASRHMRGRAVHPREFCSLLRACKTVRGPEAPAWRNYLIGLLLSGLRLQESLALSWDRKDPFSIDLTGQFPRFRILLHAEKGKKDRLLPMAPEFAKWLLHAVGPHERVGRVFAAWRPGPTDMSASRVSEAVSLIGQRAGVIVDEGAERFATAHDLRRSFGTRWAKRVAPAVLQVLMRHRSIETTMKYYVELQADDVAAEIWGKVARQLPNSCDASTRKGDQIGDMAQLRAALESKKHLK